VSTHRTSKVRRITELDRERFQFGDCHILARTIHNLTGWPIHTFFEKDETGVYPSIHAFVVTPKGTALDVMGERNMRAFKKYWKKYSWNGNTKHAPLTDLAELDEWGLNFGEYSKRRARELATYLIEQVKYE